MSIAGSLKNATKKIGKVAAKESAGFAGRFAKGFIEGFFDVSVDKFKKKSKPSKTKPKSSATKKKNPVSVGVSRSTPKKANPVNNPSLSSIDAQIKEINKTLLGIKKTQDKDLNAKIAQAVQENRLDRENQLEAANDNEPDAIKEEKEGPEIGQLQNSLDGFIKSLDDAIDKINNLDFSSGGGFFDSVSSGKRKNKPKTTNLKKKPGKLPKGINPTDLLDRNGKELRGAARASRIEKLVAERGLSRGGMLGAGKVVGKLTKEKIANIARPLLQKAGLKATAKSIPLIGAGLGAAFAVSRLLDGDVVGAGLEAVSGIGSVATAIPATLISIARDIYHDTYGVQPEEDPQGKERFENLLTVVKQVAADEFVEQKKEDATSKKAAPSLQTHFKPLSDNEWNSRWKATQGPQTAQQVQKPTVTHQSAMSSTPKSESKAPERSTGYSVDSSDKSNPVPAPSQAATPVYKGSDEGTKIQNASMAVEKMANSVDDQPIVDSRNVFPQQAAPRPNEISSSAAPVPDPNYYNGYDLFDQLYFTAAA